MTNRTSTLSVFLHAAIFAAILYGAKMYYEKREGFLIGLSTDPGSTIGIKINLLFVGWLFLFLLSVCSISLGSSLATFGKPPSEDENRSGAWVGLIGTGLAFILGVIGATI